MTRARGGAEPVGIVITVFRGGCEVVAGDQVLELRMVGRHAGEGLALAVGDEVTFDRDRGVLRERRPRRTELSRLRPQAGRRRHDLRHRKVIAANVDRVGIVASVADPPFRAGAVDRFMLAAAAGGLESILVVNKIDLLDGPLPDEVDAYRPILPTFEVSATERRGLGPLRRALEDSRTVLAGHSGVGKSSLLNALEPELRLETREVRERSRKGRHTTSRATWLRLPGGAVVVDTPGVREIATGPVDPELLDEVYPDLAALAPRCRFRDCGHGTEPDCAVRAAVDAGELPAPRLANYRKLTGDLAEDRQP